jgi:hypothetical protein
MKNFAPKILDLLNNNSFKKNAEQIASQMRTEDFKEEIDKAIVEI